jgi:hypothetical protein
MRNLYLLLFVFLIQINLVFAQAYETILHGGNDIMAATLHQDKFIYLLGQNTDSIFLSKIGHDNSHQLLSAFKKPSAKYKCQKMISFNSGQVIIAGLSYDTIVPMKLVRFEVLLHVFNTTNNKMDTVIRHVLSDSSCIQEVRKLTPLNLYTFNNEIFVLHQFHNHIDGDTLTPYYSHVSLLKFTSTFNLQYAHTHHTKAHTNAIKINSVLNQLHFENKRTFFIYELQSKILPERYVIIDSVDDSGYIYPYDSILLDESNHSMYYIQNNQFYLKRLDTYYSKANKLMVPNAADLVGMYSREPKSLGIPGEARAILPIFPPYDSTNITTGNFPLTFTDTRMLYISYFQTMHHANTVFIMTDTSLNEVMNVNAKDLLISNEYTIQVVPVNQDSFVLIGSFYNSFYNKHENHSYLITSKRHPITTGMNNQVDKYREIKIYPNPARLYFQLLGVNESLLKLTDTLGRQFDIVAHDGKFDISQLSPGFYAVSKADNTFIGRISLVH